jgi:hypothetical protein
MATLATQVVSRAGTLPTYAAANGGGDAMACGADQMLHIKNGAASTMTVTIAVPTAVSGWPNVVYTNSNVAVPNTSERMIGPIQAPIYQDPITGLATITYSAVTSVTVASINLQEP